MAVVFISPKQRQKVFFMGITVAFLLLLAFVSFGVFLSEPGEVSQTLVFNKPKVNIDMKVFDSDLFKNLQPFPEMKIQYRYKVSEKDGKMKTGFIAAVSSEEARKDLEGRGFTVYEIEEAEIGRDNPFVPYYTVVVPATKK